MISLQKLENANHFPLLSQARTSPCKTFISSFTAPHIALVSSLLTILTTESSYSHELLHNYTNLGSVFSYSTW